jgi:hypothetical protein
MMEGVSEPDSLLDRIDDVVADWHGSADSMRWNPDPVDETERKQREHLASIARLIAEYSNATFEEALDAVGDVDEYGLDGRGWLLCFEAMRTALAPHIDPVLSRVPERCREQEMGKLIPSMISAFVQMAHRSAS